MRTDDWCHCSTELPHAPNCRLKRLATPEDQNGEPPCEQPWPTAERRRPADDQSDDAGYEPERRGLRSASAASHEPGDRVRIVRQEMWPGMPAGTMATVTADDGDVVSLTVDGWGGGFQTASGNVVRANASVPPERLPEDAKEAMREFREWQAQRSSKARTQEDRDDALEQETDRADRAETEVLYLRKQLDESRTGSAQTEPEERVCDELFFAGRNLAREAERAIKGDTNRRLGDRLRDALKLYREHDPDALRELTEEQLIATASHCASSAAPACSDCGATGPLDDCGECADHRACRVRQRAAEADGEPTTPAEFFYREEPETDPKACDHQEATLDMACTEDGGHVLTIEQGSRELMLVTPEDGSTFYFAAKPGPDGTRSGVVADGRGLVHLLAWVRGDALVLAGLVIGGGTARSSCKDRGSK